jgi:hypothetical protein
MRETAYKNDVFSFMSFPLELLKGHILELSRESHGIDFLQNLLISLCNGSRTTTTTTTTPTFQQQVLNDQALKVQNKLSYFINLTIVELITTENVFDVVTSSSKSYFIQKLLERCDDDQLLFYVVHVSSPLFRKISFNDFGTRFLQRLLEKVSSSSRHIGVIIDSLHGDGTSLSEITPGEEKTSKNNSAAADVIAETNTFLSKITPGEEKTRRNDDDVAADVIAETNTFASLFFNDHSSHVIKKMLMYHPNHCNVIYSSVFLIFPLLWKRKPGCYVIQKCIEFGSDEMKGFLSLFFFFFF